MAFNFKQYTANNPLLQEIGDKDYVSDLEFDLNPQSGPNDPLGPDELKEAGTPISDFVDAIVAAREHMTRSEMIRQVNQNTDPDSDSLNEDIDIWQMAGDHLEDFRSELANAHMIASESNNRDWLQALNKIALRLDALENEMAEANAKLGVLPTK
jgi:hypothetical protein